MGTEGSSSLHVLLGPLRALQVGLLLYPASILPGEPAQYDLRGQAAGEVSSVYIQVSVLLARSAAQSKSALVSWAIPSSTSSENMHTSAFVSEYHYSHSTDRNLALSWKAACHWWQLVAESWRSMFTIHIGSMPACSSWSAVGCAPVSHSAGSENPL